ncbi:hypothetical protein AALO_G00131460 [Alosa alosa]|uniref:Uncharacterized protein n=1 Tax=Alosa alosa TaxID=278164 RepID=A0AAV6GS64_9TELE|nr:hypothetical protein AALO_G00131460 [Alosa alosa]
MASPAKQTKFELESAVGYLHCLSPIKTSKKNGKYFDCLLQTGCEEYHRLVAFSTGKRPAFVQSSLEKQAVKLTNVRRTVSYTDAAGFDVMFSSASGLDVVGTAPFFWRQPASTTRLRIKDILSLGPRQKVGELHVKILPDGVVSRVMPVDGAMKELKEYRVCEETGHIKLTLWERSILSVEPSKLQDLPPRHQKMG